MKHAAKALELEFRVIAVKKLSPTGTEHVPITKYRVL